MRADCGVWVDDVATMGEHCTLADCYHTCMTLTRFEEEDI